MANTTVILLRAHKYGPLCEQCMQAGSGKHGVNNCEVLHVWVCARQRIQVNLTLKSGSAHFWMKKLLNTLHDRPTPGGIRDKEQVSGVSGVSGV